MNQKLQTGSTYVNLNFARIWGGNLSTGIQAIVKQITKKDTEIIVIDREIVWLVDLKQGFKKNSLLLGNCHMIADKGINHQISSVDTAVIFVKR